MTIPVFGTAGFEAAGLAAEGAGLVDDGAGLVGAEAAFVTAGLGAGLELAVVAPVNGFLAAEGPVAGRLKAAARSGHELNSILLTFQIQGLMYKSVFSTNAHSRFASVVVDCVLGPPRLARHT